ncbi:hypothetical protein [Rhodoferax sp.]|uniref:hypothetical protein n=1 Tax=Rhodoferax sp. TaxID=50421 RepID=UPI0025CE1EB4|nr:hypothetical protein [Rhodoferax sp.]
MKTQLKLALSCAAIAALAACGGDGDSSPVASTTTDISVTVLDGPIVGAKVCQDVNQDGACSSGEPFAVTNINGVAVVTVPTVDKDKYPMVAEVVAGTATDSGTAIPTGFVMKTPAGKSALITALTTLVQNVVAQTGQTVDAAEAQVKLQTGITSSLFTSFAGTAIDAKPADGSVNPAALARMLVLTTQQQAQLVAAANAVNTTLPDGTTKITQPMSDAVVQKRVQDLLSAIVAALPSATTEASLQTAAAALVADKGIQTAAVVTAVAINVLPAVAGTPGVAGAHLNYLNFNSATNWTTNANAWTAAQNTPAADGSTHWHQVHTALSGGSAPYSWGAGSHPGSGSELHWSGTAWTGCPINFENTSSATQANGHSPYNYCDGKELGEDYKTTWLSLEGQTMVVLLDQVKALGYSNFNVANAASVLGTATFPAGARVGYAAGAALSKAVSYVPSPWEYIELYPMAVAAGKTDVNDTTSACYLDVPSTPATSLDTVVATMTGTPCIQSAGTRPGLNGTTLSSGPRNDWWSATSIQVGRIGNAPHNLQNGQSTTYYTGNTQIRASFSAGNVAKYYACQERFNGSARNCDPIGTGSYAIQTLGDARVLTFSGLPALDAQLGYVDAYVERGGHVYWAYQDKPQAWAGANLNLVAANALLAQLGMPALDPNVPVVLTTASYQGDYRGTYSGNRSGNWYATVHADGSAQCSGSDNSLGAWTTVCTMVVTPSSADSTLTSFTMAVASAWNFSGSLNYNTGLVTSSTWNYNGNMSDLGVFSGYTEE